MNTDSQEIEKKYFSISEVANMFQVKPSLIRFWESEFDMLHPAKNKKGERRFTQRDIEDLRLIYHLVKEKGFTLEGAKEHLRLEAQSTREKLALIHTLSELKELLVYLRDTIKD
ncbi:MAG: MerR family transcriptional regulator [Microscillaceae bacterium]|nr:MerR family transcriptional regulator [Microscillaceae bacterium]